MFPFGQLRWWWWLCLGTVLKSLPPGQDQLSLRGKWEVELLCRNHYIYRLHTDSPPTNKQKQLFPPFTAGWLKRRYNSRNSSLYFWVDDFMCSTLCGIQHGLWHSETYKTASKGFIKSWPSPSPSTCPKLTIPVWMTKVPTNVLKWRLLMTEKKVIHHKK